MFRITFSNSNETPILIQVEPWACVYQLRKGEEIEFAADSQGREEIFSIDEHKDHRFLTFLFSDEFFVVRDGALVHWKDFPSNMVD
jgi:hypothetical protein